MFWGFKKSESVCTERELFLVVYLNIYLVSCCWMRTLYKSFINSSLWSNWDERENICVFGEGAVLLPVRDAENGGGTARTVRSECRAW